MVPGFDFSFLKQNRIDLKQELCMTPEEQAAWRLRSLASSASAKLDGLECGVKALRDELKASTREAARS